MKDTIETDECLAFFATMNEAEQDEYAHILLELHENGRLASPYGEKVEGETNLFAIRIRKGGNVRFFYAYDDGTAVWILNGYEKKTEGIPKRELRRARRLKRKYKL
ncbi:MAG: type II toxin-antitoxin system RelE/ParE family toxin [Kiritimatiellae bacterium]|nr:type II toxin-antitoxin system RelE/ParE family toxin [Kiritimatiellia bacterium]